MSFREKTVRLSSIDSANDLFRITTKKDCTDLARSIQAVGLINPPLLRHMEPGFSVVYGFRRIEACRVLGHQSIVCRVADPDLSPLYCAKLAVLDNSSQRELNWVEQSNAIWLLARFSDGEKQLRSILTDMGLPASPSFVEKMKSIKMLPESIKTGILANRISLPVSLKLMEMDKEGATVLSDIFQKLNLSLNKQLEMLTLVNEISHRDDISIMAIFQEPAIRNILDQDDPEKNHAAGLLRDYLKKRRFPEISRAEQEFEKLKKSLNLPKNIQFHAPRYFEGNTYSLQMKFCCMEELSQCRSVIDHIMAHPVVKKAME